MIDLIEQCKIIVPLFIIGCVVIITSLNLLFKIRQKFPITVNCWFCNRNSRVKYPERNRWICPNCDQYNGFTEDGDYNTDIPAQRIAKLNASTNSIQKLGNGFSPNKLLSSNNGFCTSCNRNQEIKIHQLATFVPDNEDDFDEEIRVFRQKLEQAYQLCSRCEGKLNRTLNKVKQNILGSKLSQIDTCGLRVLDFHITKNCHSFTLSKQQIFARVLLFILLILSVFNLTKTIQSININKSKLDTVFHPYVTNFILICASYFSAIFLILSKCFNRISDLNGVPETLNFCQYYSEILVNESKKIFLNSIGSIDRLNLSHLDLSYSSEIAAVICSVLILLFNGFKRNYGLTFALIFWNIKLIVSSMTSLPIDAVILDFIKLSIDLLLLLSSILNITALNKTNTKLNTQKNMNGSFHRIYSECNSDASDESDIENDYLSTSNQSQISSRSYQRRMIPDKRLNTSLDSTKSMTESILNSSMCRSQHTDLNDSFTSRQTILNDSFSSRHSHLNSSFNSKCKNCSKNAEPFSASTENVFSSRNNLFERPLSCYQMQPIEPFKLSQTSIPEKIVPTVNRVNQYNGNIFQEQLSEINFSTSNGQYIKPGSSISQSLSFPISNLRQRKQIIQPSRLDFYDHQSNLSAQPLTQASWVAGGYWNNASSPQKKNSTESHKPILSRTPSQSSGFESCASSVINGCDNRSRESSVCLPETDQSSIFSDLPPILLPANPIDDQTHNSSYIQPTKSNKLTSNDDIISNIFTPNSLNYRQYEKQRLLLSRAPSTCSFNFKKFTNDLPPIEQGSLLRNWKQNSLLNLS